MSRAILLFCLVMYPLALFPSRLSHCMDTPDDLAIQAGLHLECLKPAGRVSLCPHLHLAHLVHDSNQLQPSHHWYVVILERTLDEISEVQKPYHIVNIQTPSRER